jgi:hypothetical protein
MLRIFPVSASKLNVWTVMRFSLDIKMRSGSKRFAADFQGKANREISILDDCQSLCRHLLLWRSHRVNLC